MVEEWRTVVETIRRHGYEPTPALSWACGAAVRLAYERAHGALPVKALRAKTNGEGSHCFAVYPSGFHRELDEIVRGLCEAFESDRLRQRPLF